MFVGNYAQMAVGIAIGISLVAAVAMISRRVIGFGCSDRDLLLELQHSGFGDATAR